MPIPSRVWTVINFRWSEIGFAGLPTSQPLADQILNHPVAEEKGEYTGKGKDPPEDCLWHFVSAFMTGSSHFTSSSYCRITAIPL